MSEYIVPPSEIKKQEKPVLVIPKNGEVKTLAKYLGLGKVVILNYKFNPYLIKDTVLRDEPIGVSSLGTPIYSDLILLGADYTDNLTGAKVSLPNDRFGTSGAHYMQFETVIMTVEQPIRIIKTEIQGRDGTVKEYIGADDKQITINAIITGKNGVYPREEVSRLKRWLDAPVAKGILAWWLDNLDVSDIVIESYSFPQVQGGYSYQMVTINAISDAPVELKITQQL